MKSKTTKNFTIIDRLQSEYETTENKLGKNHSKTIFLKEIIEFEKNIELAKNKVPDKEFKKLIPTLPKGIDVVLDTKNLSKRHEIFYGTLNRVVSKIFKQEYKLKEIVAAATLFMYLIDCGYGNENHFVQEQTEDFFNEATHDASTGEFLISSCLDSRAGFFNFYQKILEKGLALLEELIYPKIISVNDALYIEIVGIKESQIIPYHLFQNNSKDFKKKIKLPENRVSTSSFIDFSDEIKTVEKDVIDAVAEFWNINKVLDDYRVANFNNLLTLQSMHNLCAQFLCNEFTNKKSPILKIKDKFISVKKLMEFILIKNEVTYLLNPDLIYQDQYYLKMEFDPSTMVKWSYFNMLDEEGSLLDIRGYVSSNAFSSVNMLDTEAPKIIKKLEEDLPDFIPDSAQEVILRAKERESKEFIEKQDKIDIEPKQPSFEQAINPDYNPPLKAGDFDMPSDGSTSAPEEEIDNFDDTSPVNIQKAKLEEQQLLKQIASDPEDTTQLEKPIQLDEPTQLKDNFFIDEQQYQKILKEREQEQKDIEEKRKAQLKEETLNFKENEKNDEIANNKSQTNNDLVNFDENELFNKSEIANGSNKKPYDANHSFLTNMSNLLGTKNVKEEDKKTISVEEEQSEPNEEINVGTPAEQKNEVPAIEETKKPVVENEKEVETPVDENKIDFNEVELNTLNNETKLDFLNDVTPLYPDYDNKPLYPMEEIVVQPAKETKEEPIIEKVEEKKPEPTPEEKPQEKIIEKTPPVKEAQIVIEPPKLEEIEIDSSSNFKIAQPMNLPPIPDRKKNQNLSMPSIPPRKKN